MAAEGAKYRLVKLLHERIVMLDGATGTMIQKCNLADSDFGGKKGNNDILNITRPDIVEAVHRQYIEAGADIIETNTFSGNAISQAEYGCQSSVYDINYKGALIAKKATEGSGVFVAGSIGPTVKMLSFSPDVSRPQYRPVSFDQMREAYSMQVGALLDGGVDLLVVETVYDGLNAKAALYAIEQQKRQRGTDIPVFVSATVNDKSGRLLSGQQIEALYVALSHYDITAFGLNCSFGASDLMPFLEQIADKSFSGRGIATATMLYPNAGLPNEMGMYDEQPEFTAGCMKQLADKGLINIAGGCCGTTPEHIRAIKKALEGVAPRRFYERKNPLADELWVAGLDDMLIDRERNNFVNVGERTNMAGSAKFAKLIREGDFAGAADIARKQIEGGATVIDINTDDAMTDSAANMETYVRYISNDPDIAKVPFMIDSSDWNTILAGLKNCTGKAIVNSLSLKEGEEEFERKATEVFRMGAALVVMAFDEKGQAVTFERKIEICSRAYRILTERVGFRPCDIIFDVNVLTVATGIEEHNNYAVDFIRAVKWIKENLKGCKTSGGVSNLSFAFRGNNRVREAMHSVFLYHAIEAGLDMAIVNPAMLQIYDEIEPELLHAVEAVVLNDRTLAGKELPDGITPTDNLVELARKIKESEQGGMPSAAEPSRMPHWREKPLEERIEYALVKGITDYMAEDMHEALLKYGMPIEIVQGPLMAGMDRVGTLFGEGKMFLPQVVKSARAMKEAVAVLQPSMEASAGKSLGKGRGRGVAVLATVKGDVHDIGKNIVGIVLACNGFDVVDLGVMVENKCVIDAAIEHDADIIGVSGLITPSLEQMEELCRMMEERKGEILEKTGHPIAINVGGATTSALHTAVKLAPLYSYCVVHGHDASATAGICKRLMASPGYVEQIKKEQQRLRDEYGARKLRFHTPEQARALALRFPLESFRQAGRYGEENFFAGDIALNELVPYIEWTPFFNFWGFKGKYPKLLYEGGESSERAEELFGQAMERIAELSVTGEIKVGATVRFYDAYSKDETVYILENEKEHPERKDGLYLAGKRKVIASIFMPRQLESRSECRSAADYFPEYPYTSRLGVLVVKAEVCNEAPERGKDFESLLNSSLAARFAEAAAQWVTGQISFGQHVVRSAIGYDMIPDHAVKKVAFELTDAQERLGVELTESYAIKPSTSICALLIGHDKAEYFDIKK